MDEAHRLKTMKQDYDPALFNRLLHECTPLIHKLAFTIDNRRFGVEREDIISWFQIKFIHAFNKYFDTKPKLLKGYLLNSLSLYANRIMRQAYLPQFVNKASEIDISELYDETNIISDNSSHEAEDLFLNLAKSFLQQKLSENAYFIMELELNPPHWIKKELQDIDKSPNAKIPHELIAEYLGWGDNAISYIRDLRTEIAIAIDSAREHFNPQLN